MTGIDEVGLSDSPVPADEADRLRALRELEILDSAPERQFDGLVQAAALVCGVPISLISLVDQDRQWFKANVGLSGVTETPRDLAFCAHTIMADGVFEVADASEDPRFSLNPLVTANPHIRFYAGATLRTGSGAHVGTLCVIDRVPHRLNAQQREVLSHLASTAVSALEARRTARLLADSEARFRTLSESAADAIVSIDQDQRIVLFNASAEKMFLCSAADALGQRIDRFIPKRLRDAHAQHVAAFGQTTTASRAMHAPGRLFGLRSDGAEFPIEASISQMRVAGALQYTAIVRDTTERTRLDQLAVQRAAELSATNARLQVASEQLRAAQRLTHVGSWEWDVASGEVRWSEELFRIAGTAERDGVPDYPAQERLYTPESWKRLSSAVERALTTGESYELELELIRPNGERRWTIARGEARRAAQGEVNSLIGTLQDVSEMRSAQARLGQLSQRLQVATKGAGVGIWEWNLRTNELVWDDQMFRLYGLTRDNFMVAYEAWQSALHPDDRAGAEREVQEATTGTGIFDSAFRVVSPNGRVRHIRAHGMLERDASGAPLRMIGTNWDVTKEYEGRRALAARTALLHEFVQHAPAAIAMLDRDLRYIQTSDRWLTEYHLMGQELAGRHHYEVFPDIPEHWKEIHARVLEGAVAHSDEDPFPRADGTTEWLQWEARPWHDDDGSIGGLVFFTQVITARKEMEMRLRMQQNELQRSNEELQQFAYVASHDLQEPLRAVAGCAQILAASHQNRLDPDADELIGHIVDGAQRMRTLIHDLLALSRVTSHSDEVLEVDCSAACSAALANLQTAVRESGASIHIAPLPSVAGRYRQLVQLFQNLIGNALKYSGPRHPEVHIVCEPGLDEYTFSIRDNGIGIEEKYFERIFGVFQRLHTRSEYAGTGIGLAICSKVVQQHRGRIWVESRKGEGSDFRFTLPRHKKAC